MSGQNPTDPIRDIRAVRNIKNMLKQANKPIEYLFFVTGVNSGLRTSDHRTLTVGSLWDIDENPHKRFALRTQKTGKFTLTAINDSITEAMNFAKPALPLYDPDARLFPITRQTAGRWVKGWCKEVGLDDGIYASHSLRKTFCYQLWVKNGKTFEALLNVSEALGHKDVGMTLTYLGVRRKDVEKMQMDLNL